MNNRIICIVDKNFPPKHSFIDGMLSSVLPCNGVKTLIVSSQASSNKYIHRYIHTTCISTLLERTGFNRFLNIFVLNKLLKKLSRKTRYKNSTLFVRNEPIFLLSAVLNRKRFSKIVYQQSFPHENTKNILKRWITLFIFKITEKYVDKVISVSPLGVERLKTIFTKVKLFDYIPLLTNKEEIIDISSVRPATDTIKFVYIGTHSESRQLSLILSAITEALEQGIRDSFTFIGGSQTEIKNLVINNPLIDKYSDKITFVEKLDRDELMKTLCQHDVGLSIIPPTIDYLESSPTKLVEYMSKGVALLANSEISIQNYFVEESNGGMLIKFGKQEIINALIELSRSIDEINVYKKNAIRYAQKKLIYDNYIHILDY